jgi:hypothetical protein
MDEVSTKTISSQKAALFNQVFKLIYQYGYRRWRILVLHLRDIERRKVSWHRRGDRWSANICLGSRKQLKRENCHLYFRQYELFAHIL